MRFRSYFWKVRGASIVVYSQNICVLQRQKNGANFISCFYVECLLSWACVLLEAAKRSFSTIAESNEVPKVIDEFHVENRDFKRY